MDFSFFGRELGQMSSPLVDMLGDYAVMGRRAKTKSTIAFRHHVLPMKGTVHVNL